MVSLNYYMRQQKRERFFVDSGAMPDCSLPHLKHPRARITILRRSAPHPHTGGSGSVRLIGFPVVSIRFSNFTDYIHFFAFSLFPQSPPQNATMLSLGRAYPRLPNQLRPSLRKEGRALLPAGAV